MDDLIANFTAITGADPARAQQYLTLTDNNLEHAIQLYFDSDGADMGASVPQAAAQPSQPAGATRPSYSEDARGIVTIDSDEEGDSNMAGTSGAQRQEPYEDDEAMARRLQEEMYGQGGQEEVRAPIARTTETLAGPDADYYGGGDDDDMQAAVMEQLMNRQRRGMLHIILPDPDSLLTYLQLLAALVSSTSASKTLYGTTLIQKLKDRPAPA